MVEDAVKQVDNIVSDKTTNRKRPFDDNTDAVSVVEKQVQDASVEVDTNPQSSISVHKDGPEIEDRPQKRANVEISSPSHKLPEEGSDIKNNVTDTDIAQVSSLSDDNVEGKLDMVLHSNPSKEPVSQFRKKLLVLDINGLLVDIVTPPPWDHKADKVIARRAIFKRPFCLDFMKFCFERFGVGIWSSRTKINVERVIDYLFEDMKHKLLFLWDSSHCTPSEFYTLENNHKTLVFKELKKIWDKHDPDLPWEKGYYNETNTLLLDDSPYKALLNPPHTAIFPYSYEYVNKNDHSLGNGGDLRVYLEGLAEAENVPNYVKQHPFGQSTITESDPSWDFYVKAVGSAPPLSPPK